MGSRCPQGKDVVKYQDQKYPAPTLPRISSSPLSISLSSHLGASGFPSNLGKMRSGFLHPGIHSLSPPTPCPPKGISSWCFCSMALSESLSFCPWSGPPSDTLSDPLFFFFRVSSYLLMIFMQLSDYRSLLCWNSVLLSVTTISVLFTADT